MLKYSALIGLAIVGVAVSGCGSKDSKFAGKWQATDIKLPANLESNASAKAAAKQQISSLSLELKPDKHFTLAIGGKGADGTWSATETDVKLLVENEDGKPIAKALEEAKAKYKNDPAKLKEIEKKANGEQDLKIGADGKSLDLTQDTPIGRGPSRLHESRRIVGSASAAIHWRQSQPFGLA